MDEWKPIEKPLEDFKKHLNTVLAGLHVLIEAEKAKAQRMKKTLEEVKERYDNAPDR